MKLKKYEELLVEKRNEYSKFVSTMNKDYNTNDKKSFLDWWKALFTVTEKGIERYDDSYIRKISELPGYPQGLDTENTELCYLDKEKAVVYSGGDWQEGKFMVIILGSKFSGDLSCLEIDEVFNKNPYKQPSRELSKFQKDNGLVSKSKYTKEEVSFVKKSNNDQKCENCAFRTDYNNKCIKVDIENDGEGWCKLFKLKKEDDSEI